MTCYHPQFPSWILYFFQFSFWCILTLKCDFICGHCFVLKNRHKVTVSKMLNYDREYILNRDVHRLKYSRRKYLLHFCSGDKNYRIYLLTAIAVLLVLTVSIVIYISTTHPHPKEDDYFDAASGNTRDNIKTDTTRKWTKYQSAHSWQTN